MEYPGAILNAPTVYPMKRYEQFADEIATLIRQGVLGPGERIPSVR